MIKVNIERNNKDFQILENQEVLISCKKRVNDLCSKFPIYKDLLI